MKEILLTLIEDAAQKFSYREKQTLSVSPADLRAGFRAGAKWMHEHVKYNEEFMQTRLNEAYLKIEELESKLKPYECPETKKYRETGI